jgi:hypothetical protein
MAGRGGWMYHVADGVDLRLDVTGRPAKIRYWPMWVPC